MDNGRTRSSPTRSARQALACIRCGSCVICPVCQRHSGHAYGSVCGPLGANPRSLGPRRAISAHLLSPPPVRWRVWRESAPVKIDIPTILITCERAVDVGPTSCPACGTSGVATPVMSAFDAVEDGWNRHEATACSPRRVHRRTAVPRPRCGPCARDLTSPRRTFVSVGSAPTGLRHNARTVALTGLRFASEHGMTTNDPEGGVTWYHHHGRKTAILARTHYHLRSSRPSRCARFTTTSVPPSAPGSQAVIDEMISPGDCSARGRRGLKESRVCDAIDLPGRPEYLVVVPTGLVETAPRRRRADVRGRVNGPSRRWNWTDRRRRHALPLLSLSPRHHRSRRRARPGRRAVTLPICPSSSRPPTSSTVPQAVDLGRTRRVRDLDRRRFGDLGHRSWSASAACTAPLSCESSSSSESVSL